MVTALINPTTGHPISPVIGEMEAAPAASPLPGVNVLLEGPTGTGKTHAIGTLVDTGIEVFYLALESGAESLFGYWRDRKIEVPPNLHWHLLKAADSSFTEMLKTAKDINTLTFESITKINDPYKSKYNSFVKILNCLANFTDQTGKSFGAVDSWGTGRVLVIDALTGINRAAMSLVVGGKPTKHQGEWGIAMDQVEKLLTQLTDGCRCHFVLLSHIEREPDAVTGAVKVTVGTLGQKLAPKIPPLFSDVILAHRTGANFEWSTAAANADLKTRNLELSEHIKPDFKQIIEKWKSRGGIIEAT